MPKFDYIRDTRWTGPKVLAEDLETSYGWGNKALTIPAGTPVEPAHNIPGENYWVTAGDWCDDRYLRSWAEVYGFLVDAKAVR